MFWPALLKRSRFRSVAVSISLIAIASCGPIGATGTYANEQSPSDFMELRRDGTFYVEEEGVGYSGEYRIDGDVLTLTLASGMAARGQLDDGTIVDDEGERWVRTP